MLGSSKNKPADKAENLLITEKAEEVLLLIFGEQKAVLIKPLFLKNRTLTVTCQNTVVAQEIRQHQQEIVDQMNKKLGSNEVDRVRYLT